MKKIAAILLACSMLFMLGCTRTVPNGTGSPPPKGTATNPLLTETPSPDWAGIYGEVTEVEYLQDNSLRILVESKIVKTGYDKAWVTVKAGTLEDPLGKRPYGLLKGDGVDVKFDGPVAESYPVQATAKSVVIVEYIDLSGGAKGLSGAYYAVMQKLYEEDTGLNSEIEMIALDMDNAGLSQYDRNELLTMAQSFGFTVLEDNFEGLKGKGYIKDLYFEKGLLFKFAQLTASEDTVRIEASKWRSGLGAIGAQYTVSNKNGSWTITSADGGWIS